jgi:hypothetical protein
MLAAPCLWAVFGLAAAQNLPPAVEAALLRANLPRDAVTLLVVDAEGRSGWIQGLQVARYHPRIP